jgi:hypothetical protein
VQTGRFSVIYKFKSAAAGDVILLGPQGQDVLRLLGREPAAQGVIEVDALPGALLALQAAMAQATAVQEADPAGDGESRGEGAAQAVGLRQRLWPVVELLRRSQAAGVRVVWGV